MNELTPADEAWLRATGRDPDAIRAQVERLRTARQQTSLQRPCALGDGIETLEHVAPVPLEAADRLTSFVPASGAATRLFESLLLARDLDTGSLDALRARLNAGERRLGPALAVLDNLPALALSDVLNEREPIAVLHELAEELWAARPKALIPFHRHPTGPRTALDEHLAEAYALGRSRRGRVKVHLTVAPEHLDAFREAIERRRADWPDTHLDVQLSVQAAHTDTPSITLDGAVFRDGDGRPLLRAGGHGALLVNLAEAGVDLALIKNVDNVVSGERRDMVVAWRQRLLGRLLELEADVHKRLRALDRGERAEDTLAWARARFGTHALSGATTVERARHALRRPLRVCAVVPNEGQVGGGPFWIKDDRGGITPQIVESAQVDHDDPVQEQIWRSASHFNPVDIALSARDPDGEPYELRDFVNDDAWLYSTKSWHGRALNALEHPGLWNGSMAGWNTCFAEVPASTFHPVKTLADLLAPGHR